MSIVPPTKLRYPVIGYEEFMELYHSDEISLHHLRTEPLSHTSRNLAYLLAQKQMQEPITKRLVQCFVEAHGAKKGVALLNNMLGYDVEKDRIEYALSDADYIYHLIATPITPDEEPASFISLKNFTSPAGNRYVLWEPDLFAPSYEAAKETLVSRPALQRTLG